jgi:hypothetical protein
MKPYKSFRPEATGSNLAYLASLHSQSATDYQEIANDIAAAFPSGADYFNQLTIYRTKLQQELNELIVDMAVSVNTPSRDSISLFRTKRSAIIRAIQQNNIHYLAELTVRNENATLRAYREVLKNEKTLDFIQETLNAQLKVVMEFVRRTERFRTVPQQRNLDVKTRSV